MKQLPEGFEKELEAVILTYICNHAEITAEILRENLHLIGAIKALEPALRASVDLYNDFIARDNIQAVKVVSKNGRSLGVIEGGKQ